MKNFIKIFLIFIILLGLSISIFADAWTSGTNLTYISNQSCQVAIGTATPETGVAFRIYRTSGDALMAITGGNYYTLALIEYGSPNNLAKIIYDGPELRLGSGNTDILTIKSSNVGIGTTSPQYKLEVRSSSTSATIFAVSDNSYAIYAYGNGSTTPAMYVQHSLANTGGIAATFIGKIKISGGTGNMFECSGSGKFTGTVTTGSSRQLKKDIQSLSDDEALKALKDMKPIKYHYKSDDSGDLKLGFIAEDVPELVAEKDRKSLSAMDLTTLAITVIKKQQNEIEMLKDELKRLKSKIY